MGRVAERRKLDLVFDTEVKAEKEGLVFVRLLMRGNPIVMSRINFTDDFITTVTICLYGAVIALHVLLTYCREFGAPRAVQISTTDKRFIRSMGNSYNGNESIVKLKSEISSLIAELRNRGVQEIAFGMPPTHTTYLDRRVSATKV